ncbi:MAG: mannose-1-phosphate guanylyltransferase, partial [Nitrospirales bacterium]
MHPKGRSAGLKRRTSNLEHLYAVILAGGSGTRFWPLSRHLYPKQLLRLLGDHTLIQQTMRRLVGCLSPDRVLISTNSAQADSIRHQLVEWKDQLKENFVLEPEARNTAAAIALAATEIRRRDPDAVMLVVPADHMIKGTARFQAAVQLGVKLADSGHLVTFGIRPTRPETGYGYIQPNVRKKLDTYKRLTGHPVARFVEKPDQKTANRYLKAGNYFWNSGIFLWKASVILEEVRRHQPALARGMQQVQSLLGVPGTTGQLADRYRRLPSLSIDHGVMERSNR